MNPHTNDSPSVKKNTALREGRFGVGVKDIIIHRSAREHPYPTDRILGATVLRLIPLWVRPNHVTVLRFLLCPVVFWFFARGDYGTGFWIFLATAFTDAIDGAMARLRGQITVWGILYDPVADKLLIGGTVLLLVWKTLGSGLALFIVALEAATILGAFYFRLRGSIYPANVWGKVKMLLQVTASLLLLLGLQFGQSSLLGVAYGVFLLSSFFAAASLISRGQ